MKRYNELKWIKPVAFSANKGRQINIPTVFYKKRLGVEIEALLAGPAWDLEFYTCCLYLWVQIRLAVDILTLWNLHINLETFYAFYQMDFVDEIDQNQNKEPRDLKGQLWIGTS